MNHQIHIFGASGSGTTTLAQALSTKLASNFFDADDYFWQPTNPPYQIKVEATERARNLETDLDKAGNWILSGCINKWGDWIIPKLSLSIMLSLDNEIRMERLRQRERGQFGTRIDPDGDMFHIHTEFMEWAATYETAEPPIRSRALHKQWISRQQSSTLVLDATHSIDRLVDEVLAVLP